MYRDTEKLRQFETDQIRRRTASYRENARLVEGLYREARALGALPLGDPLEGIEVDVRLARALNVRLAPGQDRRKA
jgi:hypothetical protein